jgi:diguanylate cyclase (GGDEF)-like protein
MTEVTRRRFHLLSQQEIEQLVYVDPLSQLPNRRFLEERIPELLAKLEGVALFCFIDIDRFKQANQSSHIFGDALLSALAQRLLSSLRTNDLIARFGGDEFVLILQGLHPDSIQSQGLSICQRLLEQMQEPFVLDQQTYRITVSMGCCPIYFPNAIGLDRLIACADAALRKAKLQGGNSVVMEEFDTFDIKPVALDSLDLQFALQQDSAATAIGAEVLLPHSVMQLDEWFTALEKLYTHYQADLQSPDKAFVLSIDWPASMALYQLPVAELFLQRMNEFRISRQLKPQMICLEIDELFLLQSPAWFESFYQILRETNYSFALDHYGGPQSRLHSQSKYRFHRVKIAASLCAQVGEQASARTQVKAILSVAQELGQTPIALCSSSSKAIRGQLDLLGCSNYQEPFTKG